MKYFQQFDETDCGAACLAMIASSYGSYLSIAEIRQKAGTNTDGTNIQGLVNAAEYYGLKAKPLKVSEKVLTKKIPVPFIANLRINSNERYSDYHYVVIKKIGKKYIEIWDPNPVNKKIKISIDHFINEWTGYTVFFEPYIQTKQVKQKRNLFVKFFPIFFPHKKLLIYSFFASVLLLVFGIIISFYYKYIFDEIIYSKSLHSLSTLSIGIIFIVIIQNVIDYIRDIFLSHFSFKIDLHLNFSYISHILKLPMDFFEARKSGEILSRLGDLDKVRQTFTNVMLSGIMDILMLIVSGIILAKINLRLFLVSFFCVIIIAIISFIFGKVYRLNYPKIMNQNADVQSFLYESLKGISTVKSLNSEDLIFDGYEKKKIKMINTVWKINNYGIFQKFFIGLLNGVSGILIYWIGCTSIINGVISFGTLMTFNSLLGYFTGPLFRLVNMQNVFQEAFVAAERVGEILELELENNGTDKCLKPKKINGHIKFNNVTFAYNFRKPIYINLNLEIPPNSWVAFVGPSGSGKSTLVKLLLKFYEIDNGEIYLDGNDIRDIDIKYLRSCVGYVPQDIFLFSGTILENISIHRPNASFDEIQEAAKRAGADEFIQKLPKRYETVLGENGNGLSGGEKQRLVLARALLGNPSVIILDEATSSLDTVSEMKMHNVIKGLKKENISVIIIAHRLTTVRNCDKIFVMNEGKIVQQGTHLKLIKEEGLYKKMWKGTEILCI